MRPVARASALNEMVLSVNPQKYISVNVLVIEIGMLSATTRVDRRLRRKKRIARIARVPPMIACS